jgi:hypothetical protein
MLERAASGLGSDQLYTAQVGQGPDVIADDAERLLELSSELHRAGHALVEDAENVGTQRMREGPGQAVIDRRWLSLSRRHI